MSSKLDRVIKKPRYAEMDGILYPIPFPPNCFREALNYKPKPEDVFVVTYPKCGTTWIQNVALYIFRKGKELEDISLFRICSPFIDKVGLEGINKMPRPGAIKTHLPYTHMPLSSEAKYIFVIRNPKDCCVSFYHHAKTPSTDFEDGEFDDFFEVFMAGEVEYNDYFDHLLSWYPHRNDPNVFYTTYENMKEDIRSVILKLAAFLGKEYIDTIENDNTVLNNIIHYTSFEYMREYFSPLCDRTFKFIKYSSTDESTKCNSEYIPNREKKFIRKGIVGDWKNVFTAEQNERLNKKFFEKTKDTDIPNWFPDM